jgi:hypothetical protein
MTIQIKPIIVLFAIGLMFFCVVPLLYTVYSRNYPENTNLPNPKLSIANSYLTSSNCDIAYIVNLETFSPSGLGFYQLAPYLERSNVIDLRHKYEAGAKTLDVFCTKDGKYSTKYTTINLYSGATEIKERDIWKKLILKNY